MYNELVKRLREADEKSMCGECGLNLHSGATKKGVLFAEAADAIEELQNRADYYQAQADMLRDTSSELQRDLDAANEAATALHGALMAESAPVIVLGEGALSSKVCITGTMGNKPTFGVLRICKYKDGELREYGEQIKAEDVGEPLVTILFGKVSGIREMADLLYKLHDKMVVE